MTKIIGHRGARGLAAENTIAAIDAALALGVDGIEIDVRVTKDNVPVLIHDPALVLPNGERLVVAETDLTTLVHAKPDLTTLASAIRHIDQKTPLMVEVKPHVAIEPVVAVLRSFLDKGWRTECFVLGSKRQADLRGLHAALPELATTVIEAWSGLRATWRARQLHTKRITMNHKFLWSGFLVSMRRRGYTLYVYTLNNPQRAKRWEQYGLGGVITDRPDLFLAVKTKEPS